MVDYYKKEEVMVSTVNVELSWKLCWIFVCYWGCISIFCR
jgi:hypothetical protein